MVNATRCQQFAAFVELTKNYWRTKMREYGEVKQEMRKTRMKLEIVTTVMLTLFIVILTTCMVLAGVIIYETKDFAEVNGLKGMIEYVWCGANDPHCLWDDVINNETKNNQ